MNALSKLGVSPDIDLFASRLNFQIKPYVSFQPDPEAIAVNAFHMSWKPYLAYVFPPFCLISRILNKIREEQATVVAVVPKWPTQIWWPQLVSMLIRFPIVLPNTKATIYLPSNPEAVHPLYPRLELLVCLLSGSSLKVREFHQQLPRLSSTPGAMGPLSSINLTLRNGNCTAMNGKLIHFEPLHPTE